jgi:hypothetical protein
MAKWIKGAVKHKGSFTAWVRRMYGDAGFVRHDGRLVIKPSIIAAAASGRCPICNLPRGRCICPSPLTRKQAVLARTLTELASRRASRRVEE